MKIIYKSLFLFLSIMIIFGCEKEKVTQEISTTSDATIELRDILFDFSVMGVETSGCCITIEIGSYSDPGNGPIDGPAFYGYNFTTGTEEKLFFTAVDWEYHEYPNGYKFRGYIEFCGDEGDEICINDQEDFSSSGDYFFQPICFKAEGCIIPADCGWYACWVEGNSEPVGIDFHSDLFVDLIVVVNGQEKKMSDFYPLPIPMGNCWSNTCDVYLDIVDWLTSPVIGYQGTISAYDANYGCDKIGEEAPWGLFVYNNGMADIKVVKIVVERDGNELHVPFKCMDNPF